MALIKCSTGAGTGGTTEVSTGTFDITGTGTAYTIQTGRTNLNGIVIVGEKLTKAKV